MRVLFTGVSSFTGLWFARELILAGHEVVAPTRGGIGTYDPLRAARMALLPRTCRVVPECPFGSEAFLGLVGQGGWDILCHHAADATNYRSRDFDMFAALSGNARGLDTVLGRLVEGGCRKVVLTGSYFEAGEGAGSEPLVAFSPYGLSKTLTSTAFASVVVWHGLSYGKFVIANPFGRMEEPRFTRYLVNCWKQGQTARVATPAYVRDNVPVDLLAKAYRRFVEELPDTPGSRHLGPCGYIESQGAFAGRFAREIGPRLGLATPPRTGGTDDVSRAFFPIQHPRSGCPGLGLG
ncbi:MAG: NAD-dependent epimerase/dehydratase family protein [Alphaproteobacteria bacterium]